ncbi:MAG: lipocalin family protein [Alistipes sp.]|nr:lipocalin family protein [Alistipes sp.]
MKHRLNFTTLLLSLVILFTLCALTGRCSIRNGVDRSVIKSLDLDSYMGRWYEVARFDHSFERGMTDVTADYTLQPDGTVSVVNRGMRDGQPTEAIGKAKTTSEAGRLRVSFFWIFYSDYNIMAMGPSGEWALVGSSSPKYLWILSRKPKLTEVEINQILMLARDRGYDTSQLIFDKSRVD